MSVRIYIPTRGRVGLNKQVTLRQFLELSSHRPVLVCPKDEVAHHKRYWPGVLGCPAEGIGPTRQWILEGSTADVVVMADDDMRFSYRPVATETKLEPVPNGGLDTMIQCLEWFVSLGYIHGGVSARQGNQNKDLSTPRKGTRLGEEVVQECERVNNFHFVDRAAVLNTGVRFDVLPVMEDFHFTLSLLTRGFKNIVLFTYVWNQSGSGAEGGCSLYRTAEVQARGAEGLHAAFPKFVKVVEKESKDTSPAWRDFKVRKDVVVQWLKAYESSQAGGSAPVVKGGGLFG